MLDSKIECEKRGIGTKEGEQKVEQEVKVAEFSRRTFVILSALSIYDFNILNSVNVRILTFLNPSNTLIWSSWFELCRFPDSLILLH